MREDLKSYSHGTIKQVLLSGGKGRGFLVVVF